MSKAPHLPGPVATPIPTPRASQPLVNGPQPPSRGGLTLGKVQGPVWPWDRDQGRDAPASRLSTRWGFPRPPTLGSRSEGGPQCSPALGTPPPRLTSRGGGGGGGDGGSGAEVLNGQPIGEALLLPSRTADSDLSKCSSDDDNLSDNKWKIELAWLSRALEPALQLCRRALPGGIEEGRKSLPNTRSLSEIVSSIQRSKIGIQDWSLSDLTIGLYLIYLRQASADQIEDIKGIQISCDSTVENFIYHVELAKGAYRENAAGLAKNSMLREHNVLKFIKNSSVMRPGYYIGIDHRNKLIILGIRGTHTVYDLITDILSSSEREVTFEGYSTHFGTAEAARWFLNHEIDTIKKCISKHEGFRLRLVGHSLGGATASLLAIMLRKIPKEELGFSPDIVTAVGYATPPCVSKELAESCSDYVSTVVMQDDIIPRLSVSSLKSLRTEILHTDWSSVLEKEDWKSVIDVLTNAKQVVSSVQDVARKLADFASFRNRDTCYDVSEGVKSPVIDVSPSTANTTIVIKTDKATNEELFVPGTVYYLKRHRDRKSNELSRSIVASHLPLKRHLGANVQNTGPSGSVMWDQMCISSYFLLRGLLKNLPLFPCTAHRHPLYRPIKLEIVLYS
ncbi:hypothetical protein Sjap_008347 [Stephania japonica]|uniref:Fungal lipase-type domain-containing protein n=1 Tax=Stephania japonica TaxID=461633 RepID=A0AAP0PAS9_9MAGN